MAGELTSRHVGAVAVTVGVSVRTVWRWLAEAKATGEVDGKPARQGYALSDETWALLAASGGNVAELRRRMLAAGDDGSATVVPPLGTLHRVVALYVSSESTCRSAARAPRATGE
ncbi:hypothetical protein [Kitasatospora sp. NPDC090091]|uniref:hypothetical protein n=1 Tax=Kitasatospora sp. NPDC090091 TaxID=3364081 RepID=UPI003827D6A1